MKKFNRSLIVLTALIGLTACKKETTPTNFSPEGYWEGSVYLYHMGILNDANGKSRLYFQIPFTDTASAVSKVDGNYTVNGNVFRAEYREQDSTLLMMLEADQTNRTTISGLAYLSTAAAPLQLRKRP